MKCEFCNREMREALSCIAVVVKCETGEQLAPVAWDDTVPCHDCGVQPGGFHHPGCDMERCPKCSRQLISCGCLASSDK